MKDSSTIQTAVRGAVGTGTPHESAPKHVSGKAIYLDDMPVPADCLHLAVGQSDMAQARIVSRTLEAVRAAPGVVGVFTHKDVPGVNDVGPIIPDDPMLVADTAQHVGHALFIVAATNRKAARAAARLAKVEYEELPALLTVDQAMEAKSFLMDPYDMKRGDPEAAIAAAAHRLSGRIYVGGQEHFYLEGQSALAIPGEGDEILIHSSTQHPSEIQHSVAHVLDVPLGAVTVSCRRMGGGFGGKETQGNLAAAAVALVARITGRPAKIFYDRDDDMVMTGKRHDIRIDYRVGYDAEGRIEGIVVEQALRCGHSWDLSPAIAERAAFHADNCYYLPHALIRSYRCKTHTVSNTAFRGFGGPQGMVGIERVMDSIAHATGKDPLEIRKLNFYGPMGATERVVTPYHMTVEDNIIQDIVAELERTSDYAARRAGIREWNRNSPILKRGIALVPVKFGISFTLIHFNQAGALVNIYTDGSIQLNPGGTEMGQGLFVKVAQVVAEEMQIDIGKVRVTATNTGKVPNTSPTAASSGSDLNGMAAADACRKIKARLIAFAAEKWQVPESEVRFRPNVVQVGAEGIPFPEFVRIAYQARVSLSSSGFYATPDIHWDGRAARGRPFFYFSYGAAVTESIIDTLTGENRILRVDILHDVGKSLNPAIDLGQIEGGYVQGAGWLTMEELVYDGKGRLTTHAPSTYKIPACSDRAPDMRIVLWSGEGSPEKTIYRSKAVGEPPFMLGISALSALSDAVAAAGDYRSDPLLDAPATPERVLMAVERVRSAQRC